MLCLLGPAIWAGDAVFIPAGPRVPFFANKNETASYKRNSVYVKEFWMDRYPVTKNDFLSFVKAHPEWRRSRIKRLYADSQYLEGWKDDLHFGEEASEGRTPVMQVSWFVARSYCQARGKDLPTTDQWEYVAYDHGRGLSMALDWFGQPSAKNLPSVNSEPPNGYGVSGLYGLVWEWTLDFNSAIPTDENGDTSFCGNGSEGATDSSDYGAFLRYAFRSSLKANSTLGNLGFRCVREVQR